MRHVFNDFHWTAIKPMLPNKPRGRSACKRPPRAQRHLLGPAFRCAVPHPAKESWVHTRLLQSLLSSAEGWRLGPHHGCTDRRSRCRGADDRCRLAARGPPKRIRRSVAFCSPYDFPEARRLPAGQIMFDSASREASVSRVGQQNGMRQRTHFVCRLNTITRVQSSAEKYSSFCFSEIYG
jgi:transposase